jgi:2-oxoisovalerate dehydrogenase E1 component
MLFRAMSDSRLAGRPETLAAESRSTVPAVSPRLPEDLDPLERHLLAGIAALGTAATAPGPGPLGPAAAAELFEAQVTSRLLDHTARWLRARGIGYYTIASAGHESNAAVALALRPTDPALLHYRSGGFYCARAGQVPGQDPVGDVLRGILALRTDPIAGGRHKVFGSEALAVIPQTSTIASHLPRAVGLAISLGRRDRPRGRWPAGSVVVCSFGDASLNHSTAQGALNWAALAAYQGQPVPVLFVCEDNGIGISVPTPPGWVEHSIGARPGIVTASVDGDDPAAVFAAAQRLAGSVRQQRAPALLHLRTVRFLGHAGTDVESAYRTPAELRADLGRDPILGSARLLAALGELTPDDLVGWYLDQRDVVRARALALAGEAELATAGEVMAPLAPRRPLAVAAAARALGSGEKDGHGGPLTLAQALNRTLDTVLSRHRATLVFGEDVGRKGGVYGVTRGLQRAHGADRVFDTHLDEQSILGLALGTALDGFLPIPEIQYLAYVHNAEDQIRGEAASLSFYSSGRYRNPMVVRIAGLAYQQGFGGHFHNDNALAVLRDVPGVVVAVPCRPDDAAAVLRTCVAAADTDGSVCVLVEPIARYHTADLHDDGDGGWLARDDLGHVPIGRARTHGDGGDLTVLTFGNGVFLSLRAQRRLERDHGLRARVVDLRWVAPLPVEDLLTEADATGTVLVVDETRHAGGVGEGVVTALVEHGFGGGIHRIAARDSFVPLGAAAALVLVSEDEIVAAALTAVERRARPPEIAAIRPVPAAPAPPERLGSARSPQQSQ